ncbi:hypothetical protein [Deefgea piscis]|nr:hypothetical protein [Deefgea piscis]
MPTALMHHLAEGKTRSAGVVILRQRFAMQHQAKSQQTLKR